MHRTLLALIYGWVAVHGILTVTFPSQPVQAVLGVGIVYIYGATFLIAGSAALIAILKPNFKIEAIALWPLSGAYALYDVALWALFLDQVHTAETLPAVYGPAIAVAILSLYFLSKAIKLDVKTRRLTRGAANAAG
tara:strand:- start:3145 stop:3552 length:408 start_codon:yes stop_codon:yes gene_type:complete